MPYLMLLVPSCAVWDASSKTQGQSGYGTAIQRQHPSSIVLKCFARVPPAPVRHLQISLAGPITYKMKWSIACKFSYDILSESSCITSGNWFVAPVCRPTEVRTVCGVPDQDVREAAEGSYETHPNLRFTFQWFSMHYAFQLSTFHRWCCGPPWATTGHHRPPWALQGAQRAKIARGATGPGACADNAHSCLSCVDSLLRQQAWQIFLAKCSLVDWSMMYWYSVLPHSMLSMLILNRIWLPEAKKDSAKLWQDVGIKNQNGFYENDWKEMKRVGE